MNKRINRRMHGFQCSAIKFYTYQSFCLSYIKIQVITEEIRLSHPLLGLPLIFSGRMIPSVISVAVTTEHVICSPNSTLSSAKDSDAPSLPITTCLVLLS